MQSHSEEYAAYTRGQCLMVIVLFFLFVPVIIFGKSQSVEDSLRTALVRATIAEKKVQICLALADLLKERSADSCMLYLDKAQKLYWQINSLSYLGKGYEIRGDIYRSRNDFNEARRNYRIAVFCYKKTGEKIPQMKLLNYIGSTYAQAGNVSEAFKFYLQAREVAVEAGNKDMLARINNNLGRIFIASQQWPAGIDYYKMALAVFETEADSFKMATVLMNLGAAYNHLLKTDSSRIFSKKAITIFAAIKKKYYLGSSYQIYAFSLLSEKRYQEALTCLSQTLDIARETGQGNELVESKLLLSDVLVYTGIVYQMKGDYLMAKKYLLPGYHLSDSLGVLERTNEALDYLSKTYEQIGRPDSSLYYHKLFKISSDSLNKIQSVNIVKLAEVQMEYEKQVKEKKVQLSYNQALQKRNLIIFIVTGLGLFSLVLILILRLRIERQKKQQVQIEKRQAELEKIAADVKLESQNKELTLNVMTLIRKNEFILDLSNKLIEINERTVDGKAGAEIVKLVNTIQKNTEGSVWEEFELRFKQVHSNFYERLLEKYPDLTPNDLKLCALLKLNLSTKDICELSGQRAATLDVARYRLRKKLGIANSQVNLVTFLSQV